MILRDDDFPIHGVTIMFKLSKHALWLALLAAGGAPAQEAAISGADFTKGRADAQLSALGRQAATSGRTVVVTAPPYWQAKVAAKIRAGAHGKPVEIRFSNGFYENVVVRTEAKIAPEPVAKAEPQPAAQPEAKPAKPQVKPQPKPAPVKLAGPAPEPRAATPVQPAKSAAKPEVVQAQVAPVPKKTASPPPARGPAPKQNPQIGAAPPISHRPEVVPIPTAAVNPTGIKSVLPATGADSAAQQRLLASLNEGRPAAGVLGEAQLQPGDQIYSDDNTLAVVRLEGLRRQLYWLQGSVDLQLVQYSPLGDGRYQVSGTIDPKAPPAHRSRAGNHRVIAAAEPPAGSALRSRMERQYNDGHAITDHLDVNRLQPGDRLLGDGNAVVVVRREGNSMARYWLDGSIDLGQSGLQQTDGNVYRVIGNNLH